MCHLQVLINVIQPKTRNGRMMNIAVQHQTHVANSKVVVKLTINVEEGTLFVQLAQLVVDLILIQHQAKNVVTFKVLQE